MEKTNWELHPLGELSENFDARRIPVKEADRIKGPYPYYGASGIIDMVDGHLFDGEYLLIAEDGENLRSRKTPIAFMAEGKFWVNNHAHIIRGNQKANTKFLMYYLLQTDISGFLSGSTIPKLTQDNLNRIPILLPTLLEQQAIAEILGAFDDKIELNHRMNRTLESIARAVFRETLYKEWGKSDTVRLGEICEFSYGKSLKEDQRTSGQVPVFGSNGQIGWHNEYLAKGPGIIVGRKGNPGVVVWSQDDFYPIDTTFYVVPKEQNTSLIWLYFVLDSINLPHLSSDSAVPGLNRNIAYMSEINQPSKVVMEHFDDFVSPIFKEINNNNKVSCILANLRDTLLPKLMDGEVRVASAL